MSNRLSLIQATLPVIAVHCGSLEPFLSGTTRGQAQDSVQAIKDLLADSGYAKRDRETKKKLEMPFLAQYDNVALSEALEQISKKYKLNILIDRSPFNMSIDPKAKVSLKIENVPLQQGLKLLLSELKAAMFVDDGVVRIISKHAANQPEFQATRVFDVRGLLRYSKEDPRHVSGKDFVDAVKDSVNPDCWDTTMGDSKVSVVAGMLVVQADHDTLVEVEQFISKLSAKAGS